MCHRLRRVGATSRTRQITSEVKLQKLFCAAEVNEDRKLSGRADGLKKWLQANASKHAETPIAAVQR